MKHPEDIEYRIDRETASRWTADFTRAAVFTMDTDAGDLVWLRAWAAAVAQDAIKSLAKHIPEPRRLTHLQYEIAYGLALGAAHAMRDFDHDVLDEVTNEILETRSHKVN